jgi:cellulose synthase/poly-beta-1,6-N-acetylglucosamine synthase-like glycosyltransferase
VGNQWVQKDIRPTISIIVSAYNEEAVIKEKILNALALDYPKELLEVLVSSDGPTDR